MTRFHKKPIKPVASTYEQRILNIERKWRNQFGRKLAADLLMKDFTSDRNFKNPLLAKEEEELGMHVQPKKVDEILRKETRRKY